MNALVDQIKEAKQIAPRRVAVVVQTHWDREWYFTHQAFVARLLQVMSKVATQLDDGALEQFLFDGQTAAFEDLCTYGEPELVARIRTLAREGRIVLGPWYVMADEFLVQGESLLRNLEIGIKDATDAGNCQRVGYLPDTFGHVGQMPQLLVNFGIDSAVMWRGVDSDVAEFDWVSPDGSRVGAIYLTEGYYQHPLNVVEWRAALEKYLRTIAPRALSNELLLTQGGDHLQSVDVLAARIEEFNHSQSTFVLAQTTLQAHAEAALSGTEGRRAPLMGALRDNKRAFVLPDVLSTRRYLKRLNQAAEDRLLKLIEPLFVQLRDAACAPQKYLDDTWRMVVQNQAHDSVCGCSVDAVHREMQTRYAQLEERFHALTACALSDAGLVNLAQHAQHTGEQGDAVFSDDTVFTVFNPLVKSRGGVHIVSLFLKGPQRTSLRIQSMSKQGEVHGGFIPCQIVSATEAAMFRSPVDDFPERFPGFRYEVAISHNWRGAEAQVFRVLDSVDESPSNPVMVEQSALSIENARFRVLLDAQHRLVVRNKLTAEETTLSLLHELDAGDSYNYSPPAQQVQTVLGTFAHIGTQAGLLVQQMTVAVKMDVAASLSKDRSGAIAHRTMNHGTLQLRLRNDANTVDVTLDWQNNARDQRTRLLMSLPADVSDTSADAAFDWVRYPVRYAEYPTAVTRQEMPVVVNPTLSAVQAGALLFCHRAMQEYEVVKRADVESETTRKQHLAITMIRSVGWMSRRDLVTRGVGAGPDMETPDAQCVGELGRQRFEFQLAVGQLDTHPLNVAESFRHPLFVTSGQGQSWSAPIELDTTSLQVSALRKIDNAIELRLFNPTNESLPIRFAADGGLKWTRVLADGRAFNGTEMWTAMPHQIVTLRARP
jgi:mannosylglycerate hydrolase